MLACFMADLSLNCKNLTLQFLFLQLNLDFRSIRALLYSKKTKTGFGQTIDNSGQLLPVKVPVPVPLQVYPMKLFHTFERLTM